jgi:hypothetical protein
MARKRRVDGGVGSTHVDLQKKKKNNLEIGLKYNKEEETRGEKVAGGDTKNRHDNKQK